MAYVAAFEGASTRNLIGAQGSERVIGPEVSASFFRVFGVRPLLGRVFAEEEDDPGHAQTTVISHAFWERYFNGDPQVLGRPVTLDSYRRRTYAVIGVMPAGFDMPNRADLWLPMGESEVRPNGHDERGISGPRSEPRTSSIS